MSVVFIHYEVPPGALQPHVPFALDVRDGRSYMSLVALTQEKLRFAFGGWLLAWVCGLVANHAFLNVRTYVHVGSERGIFFLREWVPNRLALWIAPRLYGLPYRLGKLEYGPDFGRVTSVGGRFEYRVALQPEEHFKPCAPGSVDEFLLER